MWIVTEGGSLVNSDQIVAFDIARPPNKPAALLAFGQGAQAVIATGSDARLKDVLEWLSDLLRDEAVTHSIVDQFGKAPDITIGTALPPNGPPGSRT